MEASKNASVYRGNRGSDGAHDRAAALVVSLVECLAAEPVADAVQGATMAAHWEQPPAVVDALGRLAFQVGEAIQVLAALAEQLVHGVYRADVETIERDRMDLEALGVLWGLDQLRDAVETAQQIEDIRATDLARWQKIADQVAPDAAPVDVTGTPYKFPPVGYLENGAPAYRAQIVSERTGLVHSFATVSAEGAAEIVAAWREALAKCQEVGK